jgi:DnaK suppressor protein
MLSVSSNLDTHVRNQLRSTLLERRSALEAELSLLEGDVGRVEHAHEVLSQGRGGDRGLEADREVDLARSDLEHLELSQINTALGRLDTPDFGLCSDCGEAIAAARLMARPHAQRCLGCENAHEHRHGTPQHPTL